MADLGARTQRFVGVRESVDEVAKADGAQRPKKEKAGAATTIAAISQASEIVTAEFVEVNVKIRTAQ